MFLELNNRDANQIAVGKLIREGREIGFNYKTIEGSRNITKYSTSGNFFTMKATTSIKTNDNLNFVIGDQVELEHFGTLRVGNVEPIVDERQSMFLNEPNVSYILDLE